MPQELVPHSLVVLETTVAEHREATRRQLESWWRAAGDAVEAGFSSLAVALAEHVRALLRQEHEAGKAQGGSETVAGLLSALRRMQAAESRSEWVSAVLDAAAAFCRRSVVLWLRDQELEVIATHGFEPEQHSAVMGLRLHLAEAPALRSVVEGGEPVVAQRSAKEISESFAGALADSAEATAWLLPVRAGETTVAVLYADGEQRLAEAGLELVAIMAGWIASGRPWRLTEEAPAGAVQEPGRPRELPDWSRLSREEQELHLRAQRFARVQVAEIRLHHDEAVRAGRQRRDLYRALKKEIDQAREAFRQQFVNASPAMADYLHRELVRTLAHEDAALLGEDYPGPLV